MTLRTTWRVDGASRAAVTSAIFAARAAPRQSDGGRLPGARRRLIAVTRPGDRAARGVSKGRGARARLTPARRRRWRKNPWRIPLPRASCPLEEPSRKCHETRDEGRTGPVTHTNGRSPVRRGAAASTGGVLRQEPSDGERLPPRRAWRPSAARPPASSGARAARLGRPASRGPRRRPSAVRRRTPDDPGSLAVPGGRCHKILPTPPTPKDTIGLDEAMASKLAIQNVSDQARSAGCNRRTAVHHGDFLLHTAPKITRFSMP